MKRSSFLKFCLAIGSLFYVPFTIYGRYKSGMREKKGYKVDAGKDRFDKSISIFDGDTFFCKVSGKDTDGDMYVFESTRAKEGGPILHVHYDQDEWWYILEGDFLVKVGDKTYQAKPGDFVFGPRGVPHTFAKVGEGQSKLIIGFQPAGKMEEYFISISEGVTKNMSESERDEFRKAHGFERVGPPIGQLKQ
jgi:mannose-6-phosphate isomerase-like protein (cupin superfamily)